eukprot:3318787-Rhodomonas_salina.1
MLQRHASGRGSVARSPLLCAGSREAGRCCVLSAKNLEGEAGPVSARLHFQGQGPHHSACL